MYGAIEAGGTKMVLAVGDDKSNIVETTEIKTRSPRETIPEIMDFFGKYDIEGMGIGAFGPVCLDRNSESYGKIGKSPKLEWVGFSWMEAFGKALPGDNRYRCQRGMFGRSQIWEWKRAE